VSASTIVVGKGLGDEKSREGKAMLVRRTRLILPNPSSADENGANSPALGVFIVVWTPTLRLRVVEEEKG